MENIPPSYESAIARKPWQIVAPYIPSTELCALNRVNRGLHEVFAPCLWGNPASHFGTENDTVCVALTRFRRILKRVRLSVRELTHTLNLPPAQSEIYDGPHPEWLRDVLEQLPNLQSLVVSRLPFFDHMALLALRNRSDVRQGHIQESCSTFSLRLLIATHCQNTTSQGLAKALEHFPHLAFLDLSNTLAARDANVLCRLHNLYSLQVLKVRSVHLRDDDMEILAKAIRIQVRSLDVQGNHLTDHSVRTLLSMCFQTEDAANGLSNGRSHNVSDLIVEDWPAGFVRPDPAVLDEFKDESYDERFVRRLTSGIINRLPFEDLPSSGITHLYIADNNVTVEGLASLVRSQRLHVLDAGSLNHGAIPNSPRSASSTSTPHPHDDNRPVSLPGVEKLIPILDRFGKEITSLRLHHGLLTRNAPIKIDENSGLSELSAEDTLVRGLEGPSTAPPIELDAAVYEMDASPPLYELEPRRPVSRFELPGDSAYVVVSPPIGNRPTLAKEESQSKAKCDHVFAPEVAEHNGHEVDERPVLTATGCLDIMAQAVNGVPSPDPLERIANSTEGPVASQESNKMRLALIEKRRQELRSSRLDKAHGLVPGMMPKLRTLTLTGVPTHTKCVTVHQSLIQFIKDCASETELATLQSHVGPSFIRRPGERRSKHQHHRAREIFALRRIVLEMTPTEAPLSPQSAQTPRFTRNTKSTTEDADSEALWQAAKNDFTFFDDDEECGLPSAEIGSQVSYSAISEKIVMLSDGSRVGKLPTLQHPSQKDSLIDVIQELAQFRKERKAAYENAIKAGAQYVEGYWPGEVKIVRPRQRQN